MDVNWGRSGVGWNPQTWAGTPQGWTETRVNSCFLWRWWCGCLARIRAHFDVGNIFLAHESKKLEEDPGQGGALQVQLLTHINKVSQQIIDNVCEIQNGSCLASTLQISHKKCLFWNIQEREFWEMSFSLAKLIHYKGTTLAISSEPSECLSQSGC